MHRLPSLEWERSHSDLPAFDHHRLTFSGFMRASPHPIFQTPTQRRPPITPGRGYSLIPFNSACSCNTCATYCESVFSAFFAAFS